MNARNTPFRHLLEPCPKCNRDSGKRMQTETVPEKFYIVCQSCVYRVGPCGSTSEATKKWDKEYRMKYIKRYSSAIQNYAQPAAESLLLHLPSPVTAIFAALTVKE